MDLDKKIIIIIFNVMTLNKNVYRYDMYNIKEIRMLKYLIANHLILFQRYRPR